MTPKRRGHTFASCGNWVSATSLQGFRWECRTTLKQPLKKARRAYAWERRYSVNGKRRDRWLLFALAAGAHGRGGLFRRAARGIAQTWQRRGSAGALRYRALSYGQQRAARGNLSARARRARRDSSARCGAA